MNETMTTILHRRSTRNYSPTQLKDEELQSILEAGRYAPSGMNSQPWNFTVVQNQELLAKINDTAKAFMLKSGIPAFADRAKDESFSVFYHAPTLIIVSGNPEAVTVHNDCTLALGTMFLAAESLGIGSCWIHAVGMALNTGETRALLEELNIPAGYIIVGSGAFGYKQGAGSEAPPRKEGTVHIIK